MCMENEVVRYKNEYLSLMMIDIHVCGKELILCTPERTINQFSNYPMQKEQSISHLLKNIVWWPAKIYAICIYVDIISTWYVFMWFHLDVSHALIHRSPPKFSRIWSFSQVVWGKIAGSEAVAQGSIFRSFQGWLSLSSAGQGRGALLLAPLLREACEMQPENMCFLELYGV